MTTDHANRAPAHPDEARWYQEQAAEASAQHQALALHSAVERLFTVLHAHRAELADVAAVVLETAAASLLFELAASEAGWSYRPGSA